MFKTINGFTKEKMKVVIMARNNGKQSRNSFGSCLYLNSDGNHCAVGCFIPDGHPALDEVVPVLGLLEKFPSLKTMLPLDPSGLKVFQGEHDAPVTIFEDMRERLCLWIDQNVEDGQ